MKKSMYLGSKAFVLIETLLVSLTIAGILLFLYVQYSRILDSYHRLSRYDSVEGLYKANAIKMVLMANTTKAFYDKVKSGNGIYQLTKNSKITGSSIGSNEWGILWEDLGISVLYITRGNANLNNLDSSFSPFVKTFPADDEASYRVIVKYEDGSFATVKFKEEPNI